MWVFDQRVTGETFFTVTIDHVEDTNWQASFFKDAWPQGGRQRSEFCWLEHHGVPCGNGRTKFPGFQHEWCVPRGDQPGNTFWFAVDVVCLTTWHLEGVVVLGHDQIGKEPEVFCGTACLPQGLGDR